MLCVYTYYWRHEWVIQLTRTTLILNWVIFVQSSSFRFDRFVVRHMTKQIQLYTTLLNMHLTEQCVQVISKHWDMMKHGQGLVLAVWTNKIQRKGKIIIIHPDSHDSVYIMIWAFCCSYAAAYSCLCYSIMSLYLLIIFRIDLSTIPSKLHPSFQKWYNDPWDPKGDIHTMRCK
jgi:hypothetical protein